MILALAQVIRALYLLSVFGALASCASSSKVRKEWRTLADTEKAEYIRAVKCLQARPSQIYDRARWPGVTQRIDDFVLAHVLYTPEIHFNAPFMPWHRYFTWLHEKALREECHYRGAQPYWDPTLDLPPNGAFVDSPVFDPNTGFGGNGASIPIPNDFVYEGMDGTVIPLDGQGPVSSARGNAAIATRLPQLAQWRTGGGCVVDGPFKDLQIRLGPFSSTAFNPRCLNRDFAPAFAANIPNNLERIQVTDSFLNFSALIQAPHGVAHGGVGGVLGEMYNLHSSPNDPLFFLHHANLDRIWWNWQRANPRVRSRQIEGFAYATGDEMVTADFPVKMSPLAPTRPIKDFFNIRQFGYAYDDSSPRTSRRTRQRLG